MAAPEGLVSALSGSYRIERELGAGGMAMVFLAEDLKHQRKVAVKVLRPDLAATLGHERFLREVTIAANLQHPHILPLYDSGQAAGFLYYVMPFVEGTSLGQKLAREGELPVTDAVRILRDVADAMAYAHQRGVVHRDIKPANVMLSGRHALVTDFGVAKAVSEATGRQFLTTAGVALGTPTYMAPEQATSDPHTDHRADIYAFGVMAYELLTGRPPFTGPSPQAVLAAHITMAVEPVTKYRTSIPPALAALVMRCLEKKPADRWQNADELIPQLEAVLTASGGITPAGTRPMSAAPGRRRMFVAIGALAALLVTTAVLVALRGSRSPAIPGTANLERVQLTTSGNVYFPSLSPDGTRLSYVASRCMETNCAYDLLVRDLSSGDTLTLVSGAPSISAGKWTPDARFLQFNGRPPGMQQGAYVVSSLGGAPRFYGCCDGSLTPDGDTLVIRGPPLVSGPEWLRYVSRNDGRVADSVLLERPGTVGGPMLERTFLTVLAQTKSVRWLLRVISRKGGVTDTIPLPLPSTLLGIYGGGAPDGRSFLLSHWRGLTGDYDIVRHGLTREGKLTGAVDTVARQLALTYGHFEITRHNSLVFAAQSGEYQFLAVERASTEWNLRTLPIASTPVAPWARLSPDGTRIAFLRLAATGGAPRVELAVAAIDSSSIRSFGRSFDRVASFDWTRDGRSLIAVEPTGPATSRLLLFDVSATSVRELGTLPAGAPLVATTSGQEVAWTDGFSHVGLLDSTGRSSRVADLATDRPVYGLAIAPDGKQLYVLRGSTDMSDIGYEVRILELPSGAQRVLATSGDALYMSAIVGDDGRLAVAERSAESRARILGIVPDSDRMVELGAVRAPALIAGLSLAANGRTAIVTTWRGRSDAYMIRGPVLQPMADR